jgi:hypothetical protein
MSCSHEDMVDLGGVCRIDLVWGDGDEPVAEVGEDQTRPCQEES